MQKIPAAFCTFEEHLSKYENFPAQDFIALMEPVFSAEGYRTPRAVGEKAQILVISDGGVGDFICISGALREIRRLYPQAVITLVVFPRSFTLAEQCPYVDFLLANEYLPVRRPLAELFAVHGAYVEEHLLKQRFDLAFVFGHYASSYLLAYMTGAKERIGHVHDFAGLPREACAALLTRPLRAPNQPLHLAERSFDVLDQLLALPVLDRSLELWLTGEEISGVREKIARIGADLGRKKVFAIGLGGSAKRKHWPPRNYGIFLRALSEREEEPFFLLLGGRDDMAEAEEICRALGRAQALNLAGALDFRETAAAVSLCSAYIGNDTGLLHMAAVIGLPVLEICCYPADLPLDEKAIPMCYYPYRTPAVVVQPARALDDCAHEPRDAYGCRHEAEAHCISAISPQAVLAAYGILQKRVREGAGGTLFVSSD